jgi:hypothetical protein
MMFKELKQDPNAKTIWVIWFEREPYIYENEPQLEYVVCFDEDDFREDLEWISDKYDNYKVVVYNRDETFTNKFSFI